MFKFVCISMQTKKTQVEKSLSHLTKWQSSDLKSRTLFYPQLQRLQMLACGLWAEYRPQIGFVWLMSQW